MIWPRFRPSDGNSLQCPFNSGCYCLPKDGRRRRPNVQEPLSRPSGDARTLRLGPSIDSVMSSSPCLYLVLDSITTQFTKKDQYLCDTVPVSVGDKALKCIKNHQSIRIGNEDHSKTVVEARSACTIKHDDGYPIQHRSSRVHSPILDA